MMLTDQDFSRFDILDTPDVQDAETSMPDAGDDITRPTMMTRTAVVTTT